MKAEQAMHAAIAGEDLESFRRCYEAGARLESWGFDRQRLLTTAATGGGRIF